MSEKTIGDLLEQKHRLDSLIGKRIEEMVKDHSENDRPRGILSKADRRYLKNPDEYSGQAAYERRQAMHQRIRNAVLDLIWLGQVDWQSEINTDISELEHKLATHSLEQFIVDEQRDSRAATTYCKEKPSE